MRRPVLILLLLVHLFGNTELNILFKLPQLVSHYFQHTRQNPDLSFYTFLNMHYGGDDGTSADDHEDNKLPYHNHLQTHSFTSVISSLPQTDILGLWPENFANNYGDQLPENNSSEYVLLILQPPRIA